MASDAKLIIKFAYKIRGKVIILVSKNPGIQMTAPLNRINAAIIKKEYGSYWLYLNVGGIEYHICSSIDKDVIQEYQSKLFKDIGWSKGDAS